MKRVSIFSPSPVKRVKEEKAPPVVVDLASNMDEGEDIGSDSDRSVDSIKVDRDKNGYDSNDPFISINHGRFTTPTRLPTVDDSCAAPKRLRIRPSAAVVSSDRRKASEGCQTCNERASTLIFCRFPLCDACIPLAVGIPLDHAKLGLLVSLRREVDVLSAQITQTDISFINTLNELKAGKRDLEKAILFLLNKPTII